LIIDTPYNTPAAQPMTITQNIYENHFGNDINVNGFGGLVILAGVYTYTNNSNNTNDPAGQLTPSLSSPDDNFNNELNVIDNRRGINLGISSGTGSTNPSGGILQLGNGTTTNFFLPGNPLTTYISLEQNSILALDYSNSGPTYINTIIAGGPTGTSDTQESLATPGTGTVVFHQGDIVVTQQQYYDGVTQIDSAATLQLGDGTTGDTQLSSGKISFQTSGGDGNIMQSGQTVSVTDTTGESGHSSTSTGTSANQIINNGAIVVDDVNATLLSNLSGSGELTQAGAGTTTLGANISYRGATTIIGGTLALGAGASLASSSGVTLDTPTASGRTAIVAGANSLFTNPVYVAVGAPSLDISQAGSQTIASLTGDATGTVHLGANVLTINSSSSTTFDGKIVDGGIGGGVGGALMKAGVGTVTLAGANSYTGGTTVTAGRLLIEPTGSAASALPTGPLSISGSGVAQLADNVTAGTAPGASNVNLTSLAIAGNGTLDIGNNRIIIDYTTGNDPIASIATWINNGFYGLPGPSIISSDIAADDAASGLSYGIGYADGADSVVAGLPSGEIEIMFTLLGDANLDGTVNTEDFTQFSGHLGQSGMMWDDGDFNYDGTVNTEDFTLFSHNLGESDSLAAASGTLDAANGISPANVPEPMSGGMMMIAGLGILRRRRRSS
jgi:autotransporter-associated beta strand protein